MTQKHEKHQAGVCLDNSHARIIAVGSDKEAGIYEVLHNVKSAEHSTGGSEHTMNNAKHADSIKYFKDISAQLLPYDDILLFGTGKSQEQLHNFLKEDQQFSHKKITVDSSDHLTDPQMIAKVRDFFKS